MNTPTSTSSHLVPPRPEPAGRPQGRPRPTSPSLTGGRGRRDVDDDQTQTPTSSQIDWRTELAKCDSLEEAIGVSLGAASACWTNLAGAGTFESQRAAEISEALLELVRGYVR